jgi:hypothetical protein
LEVDEAIELLAGDTQLAPCLAQADFSASERNFAHLDGQLSDLRANALRHRPAMTRCSVEIVRHIILPRFRLTVLGRIGGLIGSEAYELSQTKIGDVSPAPRSTQISLIQA